jgi:hypothetical protein
MSTTPFFGGVPTEPDVDRLIAEIGVPEAGALISYSALQGIIHSERRSARFNTVIGAWRRRLYNAHNLVLRAVSRKGYEVLLDGQRITFSTNAYKHGLRRVRRAADVAAKTNGEKLTPDESRVRDHIVGTSAMLQLAAATEARKLRYLAPEKKAK